MKTKLTHTRTFLSRFVFLGLLVSSLLLGGVIWISGLYDTRSALDDGRRLLITLENGTIEGKQISLEAPEAAAAPDAAKAVATPDQAKAAAPAEAGSDSPESPAVPAPEASVTPESSDSVPASPTSLLADLEAMGPIKAATIPLTDVKDVLLDPTAAGPVPIIGPRGGGKPWQVYAKPYAHKGNLPTIAVIITGLGQNKLVSEAAMKLPENFSLSFSPYAKDILTWVTASRSSGHETFLDLPLEPNNFPASDPGPHGLLVGKGAQENHERLQWIMAQAKGYAGLIAPPNEAFSADDAAFKDLLDQIAPHGLLFLMQHEPAKTETRKILESSKTAFVIADSVLDEELSATAIQARLVALEKTASKRGFAVGISQGFPITIQQLNLWSSHVEKDGFTLVPVTFIAKIKFPN